MSFSLSNATYPQDRFCNVQLRPGSFWDQWRQVARQVSAPTQLNQLKTTGRYKAFDLKPQEYYKKPMDVWPVPQHLFWESDIAKFVEAACYLLLEQDDAELRKDVDHLVNLIESAQQPDGYLNIHFVVCEPEKRWSNLRDLHELYNAGHLIEAAVAHYNLTKSRQFVDTMLRFVAYTSTVFGPGPGQKRGYPGHPEIELALLRLYRITNDAQCLQLADFFLHERGRDGGKYYIDEQEARGEHPQLAPAMMPRARSYWYMQAHKPIAEQESIEGHSVRAMYLLTAVADLCVIERDNASKVDRNAALHQAVDRLWRNCCTTKTAVTGGIGTVHQWEGFAQPFVISHSKDEGGSYNETCASIGQLMVADRLQQLNGPDGQLVGDVAERALYNASITTGMSTHGRAFTYDNALASSPDNLCKRHTWFECACCPPNVLRTLASLTGYFWSLSASGGVTLHHFFDGSLRDDHGKVLVEIRTDYPWSGVVDIKITAEAKDVSIRIPAWAQREATVATGSDAKGTLLGDKLQKGYLTLSSGHHVVNLHTKPRLIHSHPYTNHDTLTVAYGPLIYCLEDTDHPFEENHFKDLTISECIQLTPRKSDKHGGVIILEAKQAGRALKLPQGGVALPELAEPLTYETVRQDLVFIPYYYRANREGGKGQMRCSLRRRHED